MANNANPHGYYALNAGEWAPALDGRADLDGYRASAQRLENFIPMVQHALNDNPLPLTILGIYAVVGALIYGLYGFAHSKLAKGIDITEDTTLETAVEALGHGVDNKKD